MTLEQTFRELIGRYASDRSLFQTMWNEIETCYSAPSRHYHNLGHLEHMLLELRQIDTRIKDLDTALLAVFYHDIIYDPANNNNEEESAELAARRLDEIAFPKEQIEKCKTMILATKTHNEVPDPDVNYLTDSDLSVLGQRWDIYFTYSNNIRKEYSMYPDLLYKAGRKKVLKHFLERERIFKTEFFFNKYEHRAKENLTREINTL